MSVVVEIENILPPVILLSISIRTIGSGQVRKIPVLVIAFVIDIAAMHQLSRLICVVSPVRFG